MAMLKLISRAYADAASCPKHVPKFVRPPLSSLKWFEMIWSTWRTLREKAAGLESRRLLAFPKHRYDAMWDLDCSQRAKRMCRSVD